MTQERPTLASALATKREFSPGRPQYVPFGDYLSLFLEDVPAYAERVDDALTVYRSDETGDLVGCKIKGVSLLAENIVNVFHITDNDICLRLLLLSAVGAKKPEQRYYDLNAKFGDKKIALADILKESAKCASSVAALSA